MERMYRNVLLLALSGLVLMMVTGVYFDHQTEMESVERVLLAQTETYAVYAGGSIPSGRSAQYDADRLYQGKMLCVSAAYPLPDGMPAQQARNVRHMVGLYVPAAENVTLSEEAIYALCAMVEENPLIGTWIMDGMRSPQQQSQLQRETFEAYLNTMPVAQAMARAVRDVPVSGQSEHQLSDCFDVRLNGAHDWSQTDALLRTQDGRWLQENCWRFGFVRRYPPEKTEITGVENETLHFRYVGTVHAAVMHATGWCLEEYLQALHVNGVITLETQNGVQAYVQCVQMNASGAAFVLPPEYDAAPSADNMGYAVCALMPLSGFGI